MARILGNLRPSRGAASDIAVIPYGHGSPVNRGFPDGCYHCVAAQPARLGHAAWSSLREILAGKRGPVPVAQSFEVRLALAKVEGRRDPARARADLVVLEAEARAKGFVLVADKALSLLSRR